MTQNQASLRWKKPGFEQKFLMQGEKQVPETSGCRRFYSGSNINFHLYAYAGNSPVRYTDPDGRITQHKNLNGKERTKAELKDIINGSFRCGLFASAHASLWEVINFEAEADLGSVEISGSLNKDNITTESAGISVGMNVLDSIGASIELKKSVELFKEDKLTDFSNTLVDIYINGKPGFDLEGKLGSISSSVKDTDVKIGAEAGLGIGIGIYINLSEIKDFFKYLIDGDD